MPTINADPSPCAVASQASNHQRAASFKPSACSGSKKKQPRVNFHPSDYSVICGRGKNSFNHIGNRRYRILASMFIDRYSRAATKATKSAIVSEIITLIRQAGGNFWKFRSGAWIEVGDNFAREKVGASLRDLLHSTYRSSSKAKIARRKTHKTGRRKENQNQNQETRKTEKRKEPQDQQSDQKQVGDTQHSDGSSTTSSSWRIPKDWKRKQAQHHQPDQKQVEETQLSDDSSTTSSSWGSTKDSLGFEYWLEDDFFYIDVF
jgi:hypothetical protein